MRWKCGCSYDGTDFAGWQTQSGQLSVQEAIEEALSEIFKQKTRIVGSGRTDAGVHALEQVFHFDFDWAHDPQSLQDAMRSCLPNTIAPLYVESVDDSFHARFSAVSKRYQYRLQFGDASPLNIRYCWPIKGNLDFERITQAADLLTGQRDFAAFAANRGVEYESTVRNITRIDIREDDAYCYMNFEADGFMYKMVRGLVGTLVNVGLGRMTVAEVSDLLHSAERTPMVFVAPAEGLFLEKVFY